MSSSVEPVAGIIGSGVVGSALGKSLLQKGKNVVFFDVSEPLISRLKSDGFDTTLDVKELAAKANVFFLCVPTPPGVDRKIDLSFFKTAVTELAKACATKSDYFVVVAKSTIVPTTTESVMLPLLEQYSGKKAGIDFGIAFNPEFLREKFAFEDTLNPDRIVIGSKDERAMHVLEEMYSGFSCPIVKTDPVTAEMIKYTNNTFYATKISFFNEIASICDELGVDSQLVRKTVQMDRFHPTHPWSHGKSFGGKCLPKDINALIGFADERLSTEPILLKAVRDVNDAREREDAMRFASKSKPAAKELQS